MAKTTKKPLPPYASPTTFKSFNEKLGADPPDVIDRSVWGEWMAGGSGNQVMHALRALKFIDEAKNTEDVYRNFLTADDAERATILKGVLHEAYRWLFDGSINLESATAKQLEDKFREQGARGSVLTKNIKFFTEMASDANIPLSRYITERKRRATARQGTTKRTSRKSSSAASAKRPASAAREMSLEDKILAMMPEFDPNWSPEERKVWNEQLRDLYRMMREGEEEPSE